MIVVSYTLPIVSKYSNWCAQDGRNPVAIGVGNVKESMAQLPYSVLKQGIRTDSEPFLNKMG